MIKLIKLIDKYIIFLLILIAYPFKILKRKEKSNSKKILIIKLWALGESILTLPAIKQLKQKGYEVEILCTQNNYTIYEGIKFIDKIHIFDYKNPFGFLTLLVKLRSENYNKIYDFEPFMNMSAFFGFLLKTESFIGFNTGNRKLIYDNRVNYNDKIHCSYVYFDLIGEKNYPAKLERLNYNIKDKQKVDKILGKENLSDKILIGFHIGSAATALGRRWPEEKFAKLFNDLKSKYNVEIIFTGTDYEEEVLKNIKSKLEYSYINFINKVNIKGLFYLLEKVDIYVSNDTGPMHIAAAMGTKVVGLFGPNLPQRFRPLGSENEFLYHEVNCSPCINVHLGEVNECKRNFECMKSIKVEEVQFKVEKMIKEIGTLKDAD